jgi:hypothetical protein
MAETLSVRPDGLSYSRSGLGHLNVAAGSTNRSLNFGAALLEWGFEQWKVVGSTERLMKYKIPPRVRGGKQQS